MAPKGIAQDAIGRRELLKAAAAAPLASPLWARSWFARRGPAPVLRGANDRVNLAFIGLGRRGSANIEYAAQVPGFRIAALCDLHSPTLERAQARVKALGFTGTKAHREFGEILAGGSIDAVCVAVPGRVQPSITILACRAGKDVYVETPVFAQLDQGQRIVDAVRTCRRVVQAGTALRSGLAFQKAREIVRSGELGTIAFCRVRGANDTGLIDMPLIDLVHFLSEEAAPVSLDAQGGSGQVDITFRYPDFIASYQSSPAPWGVWIHGTRATLALNRAGYALFPADGARPALAQRGEPLHVSHWQNFLECIRTRRKPAGDIEACVRSTAACLRAGLAIRRNWTLV